MGHLMKPRSKASRNPRCASPSIGAGERRFRKSDMASLLAHSSEGDAPNDVANDLQISVWAVYKARTRVLTKLRAEFEELL